MLVSWLAPFGFAALSTFFGAQDPETPAYVVVNPYPLTTCVVSGEPLGSMGEALTKEVQGRTLKLCCKGCVKAVDAEPEKFLAKLDEAIVKAQLAHYPLSHCVIMKNKKLGEMGEPVNLVLDEHLVRLCCEGCAKRAKRDHEKVVTMVLDQVHQTQSVTYPLETCVVSGKALGETPVDVICGNTLVRVCCKGCLAKVKADPTQFVEKVEKAREAARKEGK